MPRKIRQILEHFFRCRGNVNAHFIFPYTSFPPSGDAIGSKTIHAARLGRDPLNTPS